MKRCFLLAAVAAVLAGCGASTPRPSAQAKPSVFADPHAPLQVVSRPVAAGRRGIRVSDVSFAGRRRRVYAYLALPAKPSGRLRSVLILHGSGGSRSFFLPYAKRLAGRGFAALTLSAPSESAPPARPRLGPRGQLRRQQELLVEDVVAVRRAVDFLQTLSSVDRHRIGLVGWSAGAHTGALVAGTEPRIRAFVLMSLGALPISDYARLAPVWLRADFRSVLGAVDLFRWIRRAPRGSIFLQDGLHDEIVPRFALMGVARAAPSRTRLRWYDSGHALNAAAYRDQLAWLEHRLGAGS